MKRPGDYRNGHDLIKAKKAENATYIQTKRKRCKLRRSVQEGGGKRQAVFKILGQLRGTVKKTLAFEKPDESANRCP